MALWFTARDRNLVWIGIWLVANCVVSNSLYFNASVAARPGPYTFFESMTAVAAFCAWAIFRKKSTTEARLLIVIVALNTLSICANIALALNDPPDERQKYAFTVTTNAIFAGECLLAAAVGIMNGLGAGRFGRRSITRRLLAAAHVGVARGAGK
jgi:hypothetical protein